MKEQFVINNKIDEIPVLAENVEKLMINYDLECLIMKINLVIEEAVSNIIFYGFKDDNTHEIKIYISLENNELIIEIIDDGIPFDPTQHAKPDITLDVNERPIGGLGIIIMEQIMDKINYKRYKNENILTLIKNI